MINTWQIILAITIVPLSVIMPIYYTYRNKKKSKKEAEPLEDSRIKDYVNKINQETRNRNK